MFKYIYILISILLFTNAKANKIDSILYGIENNNKKIIAYRQFLEAKKVKINTGLMPNDPTVEFEFLKGSPTDLGNQTEFSINQSLDFPTVYFKRAELATQKIEQTSVEANLFRQNILLKAKKYCFNLVYLNKKQILLNRRVEDAIKLRNNFKIKLEKGDANIFEFNKAKLQYINIKNNYRDNLNRIEFWNQKLTELNGGIVVNFRDTLYSDSLKDFNIADLQDSISNTDLKFKLVENLNKIATKDLELSKALALPKFSFGYRYQSGINQTFQGFQIGISIPLWENSNKVKYQEQNQIFRKFKTDEYKISLTNKIILLYKNYTNLKQSMLEYREVMESISTVELLAKALEFGELSLVQFYMEISFFYNSQDSYLLLEKKVYLAYLELDKWNL